MKLTIGICLLLLGLTGSFTEEANTLLSQQVSEGMVDYATLEKNHSTLDQLYQQIGDMSLDGASDAEKKAFYINAYNLITIYQVIENYPLQSPQDVEGFFDGKKHTVAGESLTLNELEKKKLLEPYQDPRFHFVLVCAAQSCPPLADFAYQAEELEEQLNQKTRQALNSPQFIRINEKQKKVEISMIFEWYQDDFLKKAKSPLAFINQYRDEKIPESYQVEYYEYDWALNKQ